MISPVESCNAIEWGTKGMERGRTANGVTMDRNMNECEKEILVDSSTDGNGTLMSVPFNLLMEAREVDQSGEQAFTERMNELMRYYKNEFETIAIDFGIRVVAVGEMQQVSVGRCILPFQLECHNWESTLARFFDEFFRDIGINLIMPQEKPLISTHSLHLYPLRLQNEHKVSLARLKFGSLLNNGRIGLHWVMEAGSVMHYPNRIKWNKAINACFEYDKMTISIYYSNIDPQNEFIPVVQERIQIDMTSINRIFLNQKRGDDNERLVSIVLLLDSPPKLQVKKTGETQWEYLEELKRGWDAGQTPDQETLHDSKAVILEWKIQESAQFRSAYSDSLIYNIISRLRHKTGKMIEFAGFEDYEHIKGDLRQFLWNETCRRFTFDWKSQPVCPYAVTPYFDEIVCGYIQAASKELVDREKIEDGDNAEYLIRWKEFRLRSLLQGILDCGMEYRIGLLCNKSTWYEFIKMATTRYAQDEKGTLDALERVISLISEERTNCTIPVLFQKELAKNSANRQSILFDVNEKREGYWKIMRLIVTPTRVKFIGYEVIMGNRVLNRYAINENHIIRVSFRNDRFKALRTSDYAPEIKARIKRILTEGITYAGRKFAWIGCSNSQLRDQGCYMMHVDSEERERLSPQEIHRQMGDFHLLPNIPKMLARLGQVFTQCKPSAIALLPSDVGVTFDLTGGRDPSGKSFVFSDGVGLISVSHASALSREHGLDSIASAYQIRYRGVKGLLCLDPSIDERNDLLMIKQLEREEKKVFVRPSMIKFEMADGETSDLEIVKISSTSPAFLNRPFINILCQVSQKQSAECHRRVKRRVEELMHSNLSDCFQAHYVEEKAVAAICEMWFPFPSDATPSDITMEPFFRALLRANSKFVLEKKIRKMNIKISKRSGRLMLGVVDTTGLLQYGQIFCQYSRSMSKHPERFDSMGGTPELIHTGRALITKNPCISSGDVRMFEAVDIPALRHLKDVVVFPMHGPRPHPDEMAGSDLDGDEYYVIWDEELFLEKNEEASVFTTGEVPEEWMIPRNDKGEVDIALCEEKKAEFYSEVIIHGQPGTLSTAHLAISDLYGLDAKPSKTLAPKISQALDYQKSGIKPKAMKKNSVQDPDHPGRIIPAERSSIKPDFLRNYQYPTYVSMGILGHVFREASKYDHALDSEERRKEKIDRDPSYLVDGWEDYKSAVEGELTTYVHAMKSVLENYGIDTEAELLSGMIISVRRKRLSGDEEKHRAHYTTNLVIDQKVKRIIETTREKFFESLIDSSTHLEEVERKRKNWSAESIMNRRVCAFTKNIENIRKKAAAAYSVAYEAANASAQKGEQCTILLSFPWVFYDVLADIKHRSESRIMRDMPEEEKELSDIPLAVRLSEEIDRYAEITPNAERFASFMARFDREDSIVARSIRENEGLARVSFVLLEWARHVGVLSERFGEEHLLSLFILFGLGEVGTRGKRRRFIRMPKGDLSDHTSKGDHLLLFLDYVSSHEFRMLSTLSFSVIGGGILMRGEWRSFSEKALPSFLSLVISHHLDLPIHGGNRVAPLREYEPRTMQLPANTPLLDVSNALAKVSGCQVELRAKDLRHGLVMVTALGTSEQLRVLTSFIHPPAPPRETSTVKGTIEALAQFNLDRLLRAANGVPATK